MPGFRLKPFGWGREAPALLSTPWATLHLTLLCFVLRGVV